LHPRYHPHLAARHVAKSHEATPFGSKDPSSNTLHFKPIFDSPLKKVVRGAAIPGGGCASKTLSFSSASKNLRAQHPLGAEIWPSAKMHFRWVLFHIEISKVTGPNFTGLVSPNAAGITVDGIKIRLRIYSSVSEIFTAELRSRPKSGQILHVFRPWNFFGVRPPKFWTGIIKFGLVLTIVQNFSPVSPRISKISRSEKKHIWAKT